MGSAASQHQAPDGRLAAAAGLAGALVDAVLKLKEAPLAIGVDVIGDRGTAEPYGVAQNLAQREPETVEFCSGEAVGSAGAAGCLPETGSRRHRCCPRRPASSG